MFSHFHFITLPLWSHYKLEKHATFGSLQEGDKVTGLLRAWLLSCMRDKNRGFYRVDTTKASLFVGITPMKATQRDGSSMSSVSSRSLFSL